MLNKEIKPTTFWVIVVLALFCLFGFSYWANALVRYPAVASLGVGDIKSSHLKDGDIVNVDISSAANIYSSKMTFTSDMGMSSSSWYEVLDRIASRASTTGNILIATSSDWYAISTSTFNTWMGLLSMANQAANSVAITGGTISGITDLPTADGGTGQSWNAVATASIPYFSGLGVMSTLDASNTGTYLKSQGTSSAPIWASIGGAGGNVTIMGPEYVGSVTGTWAYAVNDNALFDFAWKQSDSADGGTIEYKAYLLEGTYQINVIHTKTAHSPKLDIHIDGTEVASCDMYNSSDAHAQVCSDTSNTVSTTGIHTIKLVIDGKNASSDNYYVYLNYIVFTKTD